MDELINQLGSVSWWISVVVIGIIINILGAFAFKYFNNKFSQSSAKKKVAKLELEKAKSELIDKLANDDFEMTIQSNLIIFRKNQSIYYLLTMILTVILLNIYLLIDIEDQHPIIYNSVMAFIFLMMFYAAYSSIRFGKMVNEENKILWRAREKRNNLKDASKED